MKPWTVLVYLAGDNGRFISSLEGEGFSDLAEMKDVGSSDAVDVVAQFDAMSDHGCRRYHLRRGGALSDDMVQDLGAANSGDAQVLLDFISWGVRSYPAEHYLLVLWNHGAGWKDDDIYAPYRSLLRRGDLPLTPPHIAGRRASRALFRRSLHAILEEEANQVVLSHRRGDTRSGLGAGPSPQERSLPPAWLPSPAALAPMLDADQPAEPVLLETMRSPGRHARAICFDDSSKDFLDSRELTAVLKAAAAIIGKKVDVLGMDACLMGMIEVAYQVRSGAGVLVASEDSEPGDGWPYGDILATLSARPTISPADLGKAITSHFVDAYDRSLLSSGPVTQSALDLERVSAAVAAVDSLARALLASWKQKTMRSALVEARAQSQTFMDPDYVDLYDLVSVLAKKAGAKPLQDACAAVLAAIEPGKPGSLVLLDGHAGLAERNAHGLAIYFPKYGLSPFYSTLDMSRDCAWAQVLETYLG